MKLINEKGKLFGLINVVDLLVLLAVLLAVGGIAWRLFGHRVGELTAATTTMTYTVRVRGVHSRLETEIKKNLEYDNRVIAGNDFVADTRVTDVSFEPYMQQNTAADGQLVNAEDPVRLDVLFTVEATVPKNTPIIKVGTQEIRVGYGHFLKTPLLEFSSTIESVNFRD
ncbi:MAG: DUF4330 domain-containing protein [Oscillospiraceae bacterium]|jgi:hypothetical protein|nr:DUF4330 domain-containing protein [Oscillospiraceae bacterium]